MELMRTLAKLLILVAVALAASVAPAQHIVDIVVAPQITEAFDSGVPGTWTVTNNSSPAGSTTWFTGSSVVFPAQAGAGYAAANFNAAAFGGAISDWLISPALSNLQNGEILTFWTRTEASSPAPDSMEVRLSLNGASTNVGATAVSVGDFTTLLLAINPTLAASGYPFAWTQFTITLSGLPPGINAGRLAFRYLVADTSTQGDYIGLDTVNLTGRPPLDLSLTKVVDNPTPTFGSNVTFTLTISNPGATAATNVVVTDLLPAGLAFVSAAPSQGLYASGTGLWTVGLVAGGGSATLVIVATVNELTPVTNTASITGFDQVDPNITNNTASATVTSGAAATVPAAGPLGLALLATILALAGFAALRRSL